MLVLCYLIPNFDLTDMSDKLNSAGIFQTSRERIKNGMSERVSTPINTLCVCVNVGLCSRIGKVG